MSEHKLDTPNEVDDLYVRSLAMKREFVQYLEKQDFKQLSDIELEDCIGEVLSVVCEILFCREGVVYSKGSEGTSEYVSQWWSLYTASLMSRLYVEFMSRRDIGKSRENGFYRRMHNDGFRLSTTGESHAQANPV